MFDTLTDRLSGTLRGLRDRGRMRPADVDEALAEIRLALLEADVNVAVVRRFVERVRERSVGGEVTGSLTPGQQVTKIVNDELIDILGTSPLNVQFASKPPTVVLLAGLQGSGKTTAAAKLAQWCKSQGRNPLLVGADLQRPAAVEQLRTLARSIDVEVWSAAGEAGDAGDPVACAAGGLAHARQAGRDVLIVDTAGRLAVDAELMTEVARISDAVEPHYTFLVVDAMVGQDAVATAEAFHATLEVDGIILTKLDGDARGGAALSVAEVVGRPVAFASVGEKIDDFEQFHPDRMAGRILGMGDVMTLIEKAERVYEAEEAEAAAQRLVEGTFTLDDFVDQLRQLRKMGNLQSIVSMMPGISDQVRNTEIDDDRIATAEAIVLSMTPAERVSPEIIDASRRARIAVGSGTSSAQVSNLLKQFAQMRKMMGGMMGLGSKRRPAARKAARKRSKGSGRAAGGSRTGGGGRATPKGASRTGKPAGKPSVADIDWDALDLKLPGR
ncbi:signal recognition particle protein [Candidatus Poriferisodalis sp.]|uniref:signal recognition particle protein n=1 Tax=Candidatus Poriferisodalis sp. TaxID=3101277 RepID=UPI003B020423